MKKLLLIAILFTASISFGQQNETWVFSGELGFNTTILNTQKDTVLNKKQSNLTLLLKLATYQQKLILKLV